MTCFGIDVSKWQSHLPDLTTVDFLFARASIGTTTDTMYATHIAEAKAAGIVTGAYHFNWDTIPIAAQVTTFIAAAGRVDLYALDVEGANGFSDWQAREFIRLMHEAGLKCGLYHSASGFFDAGQDFDWVAKWSTIPPASWDFWQYTSDGKLPGYTGRLDFNRFDGTLDELHALAGRETMPTFKALTRPRYVVIPNGAKLSVKPDLSPDPGDITISPGPRNMPVAGILADGTRIVGYVDTTPTETLVPTYYVKEGYALKDYPAADCKAEIAADRSKAYVAYK